MSSNVTTRFVGEIAVQKVVISPNWIEYDVWEPSALVGKHHTITHLDGHDGWYGKLDTQFIPPDIEILPIGEERFSRVQGYREALELIASVYSRLAFPEDFS